MTATSVAEGGQLTRRSLGARLITANTFWIALVLVALIIVFSVLAPNAFPTVFNFQRLAIEQIGGDGLDAALRQRLAHPRLSETRHADHALAVRRALGQVSERRAHLATRAEDHEVAGDWR